LLPLIAANKGFGIFVVAFLQKYKIFSKSILFLLMANLITATVYAINGSDLALPDGEEMAFSTNNLIIRQASSVFQSVTMNSLIISNGVNYYAAETVASLVTAANT
jgi:hypothetical protein